MSTLATATAHPEIALQTPAAPAPAERLTELMQIIDAYNQVTVRLQQSHETLNAQVTKLQTELASANAALQRSKRLAALGEMAAGIAHEIRNPLGSIQLYAEMLGQDLADQPQQAEIATKIAGAVRGLNGIVGDVLSFARELRLEPAVCEAEELLGRAVEVMRPQIEPAGIRVVIRGGETPVWADRELLHQALVNLIKNAAEAMEKRGGLLTLLAAEGDGVVTLTIRDSGSGIAASDVDRIFNPFFTTRATGTGLGLAIVHRIVDAHGGTISVHNDHGAVFTLRLPGVPQSERTVR